jgi:hypothetical protein
MDHDFQEEIADLMAETEISDVRNFTFELISIAFDEFCDIDPEDIELEVAEAYLKEVEDSLEIFNPEIELDIIYLKKLQNILENYIKTQK